MSRKLNSSFAALARQTFNKKANEVTVASHRQALPSVEVKRDDTLNQNLETKNYTSGWAQELIGYSVYQSGCGNAYAFRNVSLGEIRKSYRSIAPLNTAISFLAQSAAAMPIKLINQETQQPILTHPVLDLLRKPNADRLKTFGLLMQTLVTWRILFGDAFLIATGDPSRQPQELYSPQPDKITVPAQNANVFNVKSYDHNTGFGTDTYNRTLDDRFISTSGLRELFHIAGFSSSFEDAASIRGIDGDSEIMPLYYEINQYMHTSMHNLSLLNNGARPSGAFVLKTQSGMPAVLTDEQFDRLKEQINDQHTGSANSGKPLVLEGGLEWKEMSMSPRDLDFDNLRKHAEAAIYKKIGVQQELLVPAGATANNLANIRLEFYENRVLPLVDDIIEHLNHFLLPRYARSRNLRLCVNREAVDVLLPGRVEERKAVENSLVMTINEKRAKLNLEPIEGGDKIVDPNGRPIAGPDAGLIVGEEQIPPTLDE